MWMTQQLERPQQVERAYSVHLLLKVADALLILVETKEEVMVELAPTDAQVAAAVPMFLVREDVPLLTV
jgi:hypothetical protein